MNQGKLCGLIVLLCVICPVMVGYAWPVNAEDETVYNIENTTNITQDFINGKVNTYAEYTDVYANNYNIYGPKHIIMSDIDETYFKPSWLPVSVSQTAGQPNYTTHQLYSSVVTDATGKYIVSDLMAYLQQIYEAPGAPNSAYGLFLSFDDSFTSVKLDNVSIKGIMWYPQTDVLQIITVSGSMYAIENSGTLVYSGSASTIYDIVATFIVNDYYVDVSQGFRLYVDPQNIDTTTNYWYNGYSNSRIDILIKTDYDMSLKVNVPGVANLYYHVYITEDGQIEFRTTGTRAILGNVDTYPYVLLRIDAINQKISLSGLIGMKGFTDPYESLMRHTVDANLSLRAITNLSFTNQNGSVPIDYFIPRTISSITSVDGINGSEQNLRGYTGDDFQIQFKMPQFISSGNAAVDFGPIEGSVNNVDKTITWTVGTKTLTAPIKDTYLLSIGRDLYVNGEKMYSYSSYQSEILLTFYGQWLMQLYYSDLESDTKPSYTWLPGGFGLNELGFCAVGLLTAAGSGTAAMLAGRRSGTKAGLALLVAGCCGAFYLMEIMNYL